MSKHKVKKYLSVILASGLLLNSYASVYASSSKQQDVVELVTARTYIVDKNNIGGVGCSDTWAGTLDQPLCTIDKGISLLQPGDTLFVRKGPYPSFLMTRSGTAAGYITIAGYNDEMPLINGGQGIELRGTSFVALRGFEVTGATGDWTGGINVTNSSTANPRYNIIEANKVHHNTFANMSGIKISEGSFNKILHNEVYNNYFAGIRVTGTSSSITDNEIGFNTVYGNTLAGSDADGIGLFGTIITRTFIHDNHVYGNGDDGIDTWNTSGNIIAGNISHDNTGVGDGNGFKLGGDNGGNNIVKNNIAYNNKARGFDSNGSGGNVYYNNVAYNNLGYGFQDTSRRVSSCTVNTCPGIFINNIGYNNVKGNFSAGPFTLTSHNNIWYSDSGSSGAGYNFVVYSSLSDFYAASGNRLDNPNAGSLSSLQQNPQFVSPVGLQFDLLPSSPAIDRGDPSNPGQVIAINLVDIGAFEYAPQFVSVARIIRTDPNPTNVSSIGFSVTFSQPVTGVDKTDFALTLNGVSGATVSGVSGSGSVYTVTVNTGSGDGTIRLDVVDDNSIMDASSGPLGGDAVGDGNFTNGDGYTLVKSSIFLDVPTAYWANGFIEQIYNAGITGGCLLAPLMYCPDNTVTRSQMAVFLLRGIHGSSYSPPAVGSGTGFSDVPANHWAAAWIKQLAVEGITGGCGNGKFCPDAIVTRAQMAIFLLKAEHTSAYMPPPATGDFVDVPLNYWSAAWIEQLASEGITGGCGAGMFCPEANVTRSQMAVFLVRTFKLP